MFVITLLRRASLHGEAILKATCSFLLYMYFLGFQAGHLLLVKPYMVTIQSNNVTAVNEALNEIYVAEEDYDRLRESIDLHDSFDQIGLAQKVGVTL